MNTKYKKLKINLILDDGDWAPHLPSPPSPFKSPCMQNRISKTLLTLLKRLISVKKRGT